MIEALTAYGPIGFGLVATLMIWRAIVAPYMLQREQSHREQTAQTLAIVQIVNTAAERCENAARLCNEATARMENHRCTTARPTAA